MPQAALFGLSLVMAMLFEALSALFALIETGASEPLSRNFLSLSGGRAGFEAGGLVLQCQRAKPAIPVCQAARTQPCPPYHPFIAAGTHFFLRRMIKFVLPLVPVALKTAPRWEVRQAAALLTPLAALPPPHLLPAGSAAMGC